MYDNTTNTAKLQENDLRGITLVGLQSQILKLYHLFYETQHTQFS
jgi:hypothetical protein